MKKAIILSAVAVLSAFPIANTVYQLPEVQAIQQQQPQQYQQLLALGASLNPYQSQQTLQLLGVGQINPNNTVYVDGNTIHRYLNDGSGPETIVYSSAVIQMMQPGNGVIVQIVTPQNITLVSAATYQNAAITAGAQNANIRIAAASPVTGEGALAGVYALLEKHGVQVNPKDVQVAQQEIKVVSEVTTSNNAQQNGLTDQQVNKMLAEIKAEVVDLNQKLEQQTTTEQTTTEQTTTETNDGNEQNAEQNNQVDNDAEVENNTNITGDNNVVSNDTNIDQSTEINNIVNNIVNEYNITDQSVIQNIQIYAQEYADTESAKNPETKEQLQQSITDREPAQAWPTVLQGLTMMPVDQILAAERIDYSNTEIYAPIMQELQTELYKRIEAGDSILDLYSDTFVFEASQSHISNNNQHAINELRTIMYQYAANEDMNNQGNPNYVGVKDRWLAEIVNINYLNPEYQEILRQLTVTTGLAPQVYNYQPVDSNNQTINFNVNVDNSDNSTTEVMNVSYNLENGEIKDPEAGGGFFGLGGDDDITDKNYLSETFDADVEITRPAVAVNLSPEDIVQDQAQQESQAEMYIPVETEEGFEESFEELIEETSQVDLTEVPLESENQESSDETAESVVEETTPEEEMTMEETTLEETTLEETTLEETTEEVREFPPAQDWGNLLQGLNPVPVEQLLGQEREDFSDSEVFNPLMDKLLTELYSRMERNESLVDLYAHTFVYEASQEPGTISPADAYAIEFMRTMMYQYTANEDQEMMADPNISNYVDVKTRWTDKLMAYDNLQYTDPSLHEIIRQIMVATGRAPQVYTYSASSQNGSVVSFEIFYDNPAGHTSDMLMIDYDMANGSITDSNGGFFGGGDLSQTNYLADQYGVDLPILRQPMSIDPNYQAPVTQYIEETSAVEEDSVTELYEEETVDPNEGVDPNAVTDPNLENSDLGVESQVLEEESVNE